MEREKHVYIGKKIINICREGTNQKSKNKQKNESEMSNHWTILMSKLSPYLHGFN